MFGSPKDETEASSKPFNDIASAGNFMRTRSRKKLYLPWNIALWTKVLQNYRYQGLQSHIPSRMLRNSSPQSDSKDKTVSNQESSSVPDNSIFRNYYKAEATNHSDIFKDEVSKNCSSDYEMA